MADDPSFQDLRDDAKAWDISAGGSKDELSARLAEHRAVVALELGDRTDAELVELAGAHGVPTDRDREGLIEQLVAAHVAWHDGEGAGDDPQVAEEAIAQTDAGDGTVWMGSFHVEVGSEAHRALVERGFEPGPAPDAG